MRNERVMEREYKLDGLVKRIGLLRKLYGVLSRVVFDGPLN